MGLSPNNTLFQGTYGLYCGVGDLLKKGGDISDSKYNGELMLGGTNPQFYLNSPSPFTYVNILEPYDEWLFILDE